MTNKKRFTISILCLLMLIVSMFAFSACGGKVENFNLSFKVDGESYSTISTNGSEIVTIPENPTKEGYEFDGWYWDENVWSKPFTANSLLNAPISSDMSVYAKFDAISYDITYETDNGSHSNPVSYTIEDSFALSDAEKLGYNFVGWYSDDTYTTEVTNISVGSMGAITLYAKYEVATYTITYENTKDATNNNVTSYTIERATITLENLEKLGYTFDGWYKDETKVTEIATGSTGNLTLTAQWKPISYTVSYENTKGATNNNVTSYTIESATITLENLEKLGYTFDGWYNNGTKVTDIAIGSTSNLTLTAQWKPISYTISYENTKGATNNNITSYTIESETITLENLEKLGYTFDGWYNNGTKVTEIATGSTGDLTLTAQWTPIGYEIKYHNVTGATNNNPDVYDVEDQPLALSDASKVGYTFTGWYTDSTCQNKIDKIAVGTTGDLNLYAGWELIEYTATFKDGNNTVKEVTFTVETESIEEPTVPVHNGYTGQWADYELAASDITINAEYVPIVYAITYENIQGVDNKNVATYTIESETITLVAVGKPHYTFDGWYNNGTKVTDIATGSTGNLTLTAQWTPVSYTIFYENTKGATNNNITSYTIESETITLENLEKLGYTFDGWYNNGTKVTEIATGSTGDLTLTAQWTPIGYEIKYHNVTGATNNNPDVYDVEDQPLALSDASKVGYTFTGWYTDSTCQNKIDKIAVGTTGDLNLYAGWELIEYTATFKDGDDTVGKVTFTVETESIEEPTVPNHNGYTGQWDDYELGVSDITINAEYTPIVYTIDYENINNTTNNNVTSYTIESATITLENLEKPGYIFDGWYNNATKVTEIATGSIGNLTLTAKWTPVSYTVSYENIKGATNNNVTSYTIESETITLENLEKLGYTFDGWYSHGTKVTEIATGSIGNLTLTAKWTPVSYTVSYENIKGATNNNVTSYTIESATITLGNLEKLGYTFDGWYSNGTKVSEIATGSTDNLTLIAQWTPVSYTISYENTKGATNNNVTSYNIESESITLENLENLGYTFDGWYSNGTKVSEIATGSTGNLTLVAQWTPIEYEIKYHNVTGATNDNPSAYTIESEIITLLAANKVGYTFLGWYTDAMFENNITEIPTGTTGILSFYAKWEIITYTITYRNTKEATNPNPTTYTVESEIELSKIFATNYTFNGWYSGMNLFTIVPKGSTGNLVLTATWIDLSLGIIDYDHEKVAISVDDEITAELFKAKCYDSNNMLATMSIEVVGSQVAGETITVRLIATSGNKTKQETITNIKVYGTPTLTVSNDSKDYINETDTLNGDLFGAIGTDSFGATTEILVSIEGDFSAGNLVTVVITAVDPAQNTFVWKKDNIKVYGSPTISIKNTNIKESDGISIDSLGAVATDSFGVTQNVSIDKVDYGFSNGGVYKYQTSTMEDSVVFTALNTERYTLHYKNGYSGDRTYITVYCVTTNTTIRARSYYTNTGYSTFGFSVTAGYEYKICTQAYSSSYTTEFYMYLTSTSLTETVVAEEAQVILKSTDAYGNIGEKLVKIKVFGLPTISEAAITDFNVGDEISVESLKLTAVDTYNQLLEISLVKKSGEQIAGSTMVYTATVTDIVGNVSVKDIEIKFYGTPTINVGRTHIKVDEIINTTTLQAIAKDSFGNTLNVTMEKLEGSQIGGSTMRYLLTTAPDKVGNTHNVTVSISVYDENEIELTFAPSTFIKLTSKGEEFLAEAQDSFGNACEISLEAASGYTLTGGEVVTLYIVATDKAGNIKKSDPINNIKVYDIPTETLTNPSNGYSILEDGALSLLFTVHDSFGEEVYADITTNDELVGGRFISVTINATDVAGNILTKTYDSIAVFSEEYPIYAELYIDGEFWKGEFVKDYLSVPQISGQDFYAWIDTEWNIYTDSTGKILNDTISGFVKFDGVLYSEGYSPIASAADLTEMGLSGKYILVRDIDLANVNWTPIGTQTSPFTGELNGNGYTVHNFKVTTGIKDSSYCFAGLIGYNNGTIKNIRVEEFYISIRTGSTYVCAGGLVGYNTGTIIDCTVNYNYISGSAFFASQYGNVSYAGGITGCNTGTIENSYVAGGQYVKAWGNSSESEARAGGITGLNGNGGVIINCCATGNVIVSAYDAYAGGLVGFNNKGQISYSYSTCNIESNLHEQSSGQWNANIDAGGIAGANYGSTGLIKYCYATGDVTASASSAERGCSVKVGGLVGDNYEGAVITDCYATGNVIGVSELSSAGVYAGGLVGYNHDDILNCYATGDVSATALSGSASVYAGGLLGYLSASNSNGRVKYSYATGNVSAISNSTSSTSTACAGGLIAYESITFVNYSYRCSGQIVTATINSAEGTIHKNNLKSLETIQTVSFHTDTLLWDSSIWNIRSGAYPTLYGVGVK